MLKKTNADMREELQRTRVDDNKCITYMYMCIPCTSINEIILPYW